MESGEVVRAVAEQIKPACVVAVDALASRSLRRVCRTIQLADTGITPGSGVGNARAALNAETLGVPVIAVGVPTVVDAATLTCDVLAEAGKGELNPAALQGAGDGLIVTPKDCLLYTSIRSRCFFSSFLREFSTMSRDMVENSRRKLEKKHLDLIDVYKRQSLGVTIRPSPAPWRAAGFSSPLPASASTSQVRVAASTTVGTPTAMTGTPRVSALRAARALPTPEPGVMPVSASWMVRQTRRRLREARASTATTQAGLICSATARTTSPLSMPCLLYTSRCV